MYKLQVLPSWRSILSLAPKLTEQRPPNGLPNGSIDQSSINLEKF